jgi:hypothetical protein
LIGAPVALVNSTTAASEEARPRVRMYPHHVDYSAMEMQFRPFAMYMHPTNYVSAAVNTDDLGLRTQYLGKGKRINWRELRKDFDACDVLVGNSTVFGVDCSSDKTTITHFLNRDAAAGSPPVLNIGIRGATSRQELVVFQSLRPYMPEVRNIVIFSGILGATSIALPNTYIDSDFGIISEEAYNLGLLCKQYELGRMDALDRALHNFHAWVDLKLRTHKHLERFVQKRFGKPGMPLLASEPDRQTKFSTVMDLFAGDMANWAALARGIGARVHFVLQPAINWTRKPLSRDERKLFEIDLASGYYLDRYATQEFYGPYRDSVEAVCAKEAVSFSDANEWFNEPAVSNETLFVDVCHLTDRGNQFVADHIRSRILIDVS